MPEQGQTAIEQDVGCRHIIVGFVVLSVNQGLLLDGFIYYTPEPSH